jgi:DNA polymerase-3 subunit beta
MKLLILKNNLKQGINITSRLTQKSISLPILNNILLQTEKNFLKISSTDLEIGIHYWVLAKIEKQGQIAVPGRTLSGLIDSLFDEKIMLESRANVLLIQGKSFQSKILSQSPEDYPIIPELKEDFIEVDNSTFIQGLSQVADVAAITQIRPELSGIYLSFDEKRILMAASDSFRLAERKIIFPQEIKMEKEQAIILPSKTARELINILDEKQGKLRIYFSPNQIMFETEMPEETAHPQLQITSRLIEGSYPNYREIIPQQFKTEITLSKREFLDHIKTASLFSGKANETQLTVIPKKGLIEVFSQSSELGENKSTLSGKIKGESVKASFNYRFLADGLSKIKTSEVVFQLNGEEGPALLKPFGDENYFYIVMPIKPS